MQGLLLSVFIFMLATTVDAQIPVSKEPRHPLVFENSKVRLLNVHLKPGDTTQYHIHSTPSVFIFFTRTTTGSQVPNRAPVQGTSTPGTVLYENLAAPNTRVHRVWNVDTSTFHVMDIELLSPSKEKLVNKALSAAHLSLKIDTPGIRTYNITLHKDDRVQLSRNPSGFVLVSLQKAQIELIRQRKKSIAHIEEGQFYWIDPNENFSIKNVDVIMENFVLLELN